MRPWQGCFINTSQIPPVPFGCPVCRAISHAYGSFLGMQDSSKKILDPQTFSDVPSVKISLISETSKKVTCVS